MEPIQNAPVNFFIGGGKYISDNFNMQILDTSNPSCFENLNLQSIMPDLMNDYINSEKLPEQTQSNEGFWAAIIKFFTAAPSPQEEKIAQ